MSAASLQLWPAALLAVVYLAAYAAARDGFELALGVAVTAAAALIQIKVDGNPARTGATVTAIMAAQTVSAIKTAGARKRIRANPRG